MPISELEATQLPAILPNIKDKTPTVVLGLSFGRKLNLIKDYLAGYTLPELKHKYGISGSYITKIITSQDIATKFLTTKTMGLVTARETLRIASVKDKMITLVESVIDEVSSQEGSKLGALPQLTETITTLDKFSRLNQEKATEITKTENTEKRINYADLLSNLESEQDKRDFLLGQLKNK